MNTEFKVPREFVESLAGFRFPPKADARIQYLMDRNTDGRLSGPEREELEALVELSETMSLFRAQAMTLLGRKPK
jgi:hypothetical protein